MGQVSDELTAAKEPLLTAQDDRSVLGRAFAILGSFDDRRSQITLAELADRVSLPKTTVHRLARQLVDYGALECGSSPGSYRLGMLLFELGGLVPSRRRLRETALPFIEDLYETTHETIHFGMLDGTEVVYLERISGHNAVACPTRPGGRMPAYCTAIGKALLAFNPEMVQDTIDAGLRPRTRHTLTRASLLREQLEQVHETGIAFDREEGQLGVACVGAPILDRRGMAIAAISVTSQPRGLQQSRYIGAVQATATSLGRALRKMPDSYWDQESDRSAALLA